MLNYITEAHIRDVGEGAFKMSTSPEVDIEVKVRGG